MALPDAGPDCDHLQVPGADVAAAALRQVASLAELLRDSPAKTLGPEHLDVLRGSGALLARMGALATQERALPGGASDTALRRLAAPAREFAKHVSNLARALEIGVPSRGPPTRV